MNVIGKDPQVRVKINQVLERYNRYPWSYQAKIGYDALIRNVIPKELINMMSTTLTDLDIKLKKKTSIIKYLEGNTNCIQRKKNIKMFITAEFVFINPEIKEMKNIKNTHNLNIWRNMSVIIIQKLM